MVELTHSRQGLPEQRWRDSEAVACQLLEDGSQRGQGTSAPRLHEDAKRAAHRQTARLGDSTAHAFVNEEQFRVEPLCEQDGRRVSRVQAQIGRGHLSSEIQGSDRMYAAPLRFNSGAPASRSGQPLAVSSVPPARK